MEFAWQSVWNITDSVPANCQVFVDNGGLDLFMKCKVGIFCQTLALAEIRLLSYPAEVPEFCSLSCTSSEKPKI